jgi:N-acetylmuramoyl-L-alanine amidase
VFFRRYFIVIAILGGICASRPVLATAARPLEGKILVLDPGHAVKNDIGRIINPGAKSRRGVLERDIALHVVETMTPLLEAQGARVYLTRTRTNPWRYGATAQSDNRGRATLANLVHADAYIRIHCDWNRNRRFRGFTTFYYRWRSRELAKFVHEALVKALPMHRDNGVKRRSFVSASAQMPAVLAEMGVLSNSEEGKYLAQELHQAQVAMAMAEGVIAYFQSHAQVP